jgi:hypothetical protein
LTDQDKYRELYSILYSRTISKFPNQTNQFDSLCGALLESGNEWLAEALRNYKVLEENEIDPSPGMCRLSRQRILRNIEKFAKSTSSSSLLFTHLEAAGVIDRTERQTAVSVHIYLI